MLGCAAAGGSGNGSRLPVTREDFTITGRAYDVILDLAAHRSAFAYRGSLAPGGRFLYVGRSVGTLLQVLLLGPVLGRAEGKKIRLLAVRLSAITELSGRGVLRSRN